MSTAASQRPQFRIPILFAALGGILIGYGIGHFQGNQATQAVQEKLETSDNNLKIAREATGAVEKQSARLLGRAYLSVALMNLNKGDERTARGALAFALKSFQRGEISTSKDLTAQLTALSQGSLSGKQQAIQDVCAKFDASLSVPTGEGSGGR